MIPAIPYIRLVLCAALFVCGLGFSSMLFGQSAVSQGIQVRVSSPSVLLGEPFTVSVQAVFAANARPTQWPGLPDSLSHFELLEPVRTDSSASGGLITVTRVYRMTSFDSGRWKLPVLVTTAGKKRYQSDTLSVDVQTVALEGNAYRDIHDIIEVQETPVNWMLWGALALSVVLVGLGAWYYLRNRKRPLPVTPVFDSKLSPLDQALQALLALRAEALVGKGDVKGHFSRLSDTLRVFLTRKFHVPVMADTTDGILLRLKDLGADRENISSLASLLRLSDAVKFAKFTVPEGEANDAVDQMEIVIKALNQQKTAV